MTLTISTRGGGIDLVRLRPVGARDVGVLPGTSVGGLLIGLQLDPPEGNAKADAHQAAEGVQAAASQTGTILLGPLQSGGHVVGSLRGFVGRGGARARARAGGLLVHYVLDGSAQAYIRPREPFDRRPLPVLASPDVARSAGPGGVLALQVDGIDLRARVVATSSRFPTESGSPFLVADERSLAAALAADIPADSLPSELWLGVRRRHPPRRRRRRCAARRSRRSDHLATRGRADAAARSARARAGARARGRRAARAAARARRACSSR